MTNFGYFLWLKDNSHRNSIRTRASSPRSRYSECVAKLCFPFSLWLNGAGGISAQISVQVVEITKCNERNFVTPAQAGGQFFICWFTVIAEKLDSRLRDCVLIRSLLKNSHSRGKNMPEWEASHSRADGNPVLWAHFQQGFLILSIYDIVSIAGAGS